MTEHADPPPRDRFRLATLVIAAATPLWLVPLASPSQVLAGGGTLVLGVWSGTQAALFLLHLACLPALFASRAVTGRARRRRLLISAAGCLGLALACLAGEGLLRVWPGGLPRSALRHLEGAVPFRLSEPRFCVFDGPWVWRGQPNLELPALPTEPELVREGRLLPHRLAEPQERVALRYDAQGLRNPEPWGPVELLAVGDSFTFGWNLPREAAWPALLEELSQRPTRSVAFNAWGPSQALAAFQAFGLPKQPRAVVWTVFAGNDLPEEAAWRAQSAAGQLPVAFQPRPPRQLPPPRGSRLLALLGWGLEALPLTAVRRADSPREALTATVGGAELAVGFSAESLRALGAEPGHWPQHPGFAGALEAVTQGQRLTTESGARFVCLLIPTKEEILYPLLPEQTRHQTLLRAFPQLDAEPEARREQVLATLDAALRARGSALLDQIRDALAERGVRCLDLRPALTASYQSGRPPYFALDSHWNRAGHRLVAERVQAWLQDE